MCVSIPSMSMPTLEETNGETRNCDKCGFAFPSNHPLIGWCHEYGERYCQFCLETLGYYCEECEVDITDIPDCVASQQFSNGLLCPSCTLAYEVGALAISP